MGGIDIKPNLRSPARWAGRLGLRSLSRAKRFRLAPDQPYKYRYVLGTYERGTKRVVNRLLQPGMVAVDVGAHIGYYTRLFARLVGREGHVYAFEPDPLIFSVLQENAQRYEQVTCAEEAVSDRVGTAMLYRSHWSSRSSLWEGNAKGEAIEALEVSTVTLDSVLPDRPVDIVKVDVEGNELEVLDGIKETVQRSPNIALIVECDPKALAQRDFKTADLIAALTALDLHVQIIENKSGRVHPADTEADVERVLRHEGSGRTNLLATRNRSYTTRSQQA